MGESFFKGFFNELGDQVNSMEKSKLQGQRDNANALKKENLQDKAEGFKAGESALDRQNRLDVANIQKDAKLAGKEDKGALTEEKAYDLVVKNMFPESPEKARIMAKKLMGQAVPDETELEKIGGVKGWLIGFLGGKPEREVGIDDGGGIQFPTSASAAPTTRPAGGMDLPRTSNGPGMAPPVSAGSTPRVIRDQSVMDLQPPKPAAGQPMPVEKAVSYLGQDPSPANIQFFIDTYGAEALPSQFK